MQRDEGRGSRSVSCVVAAFNEAATVGEVVQRLLALVPGVIEVVVVDDGSTDGTAEVASAAGAQVVRLLRNQGKGAAVRAGLRAARGDVVLMMDADGQDDPAEAPRLIEALTPGVDMVIGSRFLGVFRDGAVTRLHHAGNRFLTAAFNLLYGQRITDAQAGFRAFRRNALDPDRMDSVRYEVEADINTLVALGGGRIVEVPVSRDRRRHGRSGFRSFRDGIRILIWMLRRRVRPPGPARPSVLAMSVREERLLASDRGLGAVAADQAGLLGQGEDLVANRGDEGLVVAAPQVGAPDAVAEDGVPAHQSGRIGPDQKPDPAGGVAGEVQDLGLQGADRNVIALVQQPPGFHEGVRPEGRGRRRPEQGRHLPREVAIQRQVPRMNGDGDPVPGGERRGLEAVVQVPVGQDDEGRPEAQRPDAFRDHVPVATGVHDDPLAGIVRDQEAVGGKGTHRNPVQSHEGNLPPAFSHRLARPPRAGRGYDSVRTGRCQCRRS